MPLPTATKRLLATGAPCLIALAYLLSGPAVTARNAFPTAQEAKDQKYQNAAACTRCHVQPGGNDFPRGDPKGPQALNIVLLTEYAIWKTHDKHAQAYAVLLGPRGQTMGRLLGGIDVTKKEAGCLNCHAMANLAGNADEGGLDVKDGVSCGGCHGPSSAWLAEHALPAWRKKSAEEKTKLGMRDLRDPEVRTQLCTSCHVGNPEEGKIVTHAMFAAGHPPLPSFEVATFSRNQPPHWRDARNVPYFQNPSEEVVKNYHLEDVDFQQTKLALVGSVVALRQTMKLAAGRADFTARNPLEVWPELLTDAKDGKLPGNDSLRKQAAMRWPELAMAHSDCFACHHDLKFPGYRQERGFGYFLPGLPPIRTVPGRPLIRTWPTILPETCALYLGKAAAIEALGKRLSTLALACGKKPFGDPAEIAAGAGGLVQWSDELVVEAKKARYTRDSVLKMMHHLSRAFDSNGSRGEDKNNPSPTLDYESARQVASLLRTAFDEWKKSGGKAPEADTVLEDLTVSLNLQPYAQRDKRLDVIFQIVQKSSRSDSLKGKAEFQSYLKDIGSIDSIRNLDKAREFLDAVRAMSNEDFNNGLVKDHIATLQKLSDEEEVQTLRAVSSFDPEIFKKKLREFAKGLPTAPR